MTIALIFAHPDDETLACGGTIAMLSQKEEVHLFVLGQGGTDRGEDAIKHLQECCRRASDILGITQVSLGDFVDQRMDTYALLDIVRPIEAWLRTVKPDTVFTHWYGDMNQDHQVVNKAVMIACRPGSGVRRIYECEVPSSSEWGREPFPGGVFYDISATLSKKIEALECYDGEIRPYPHPRSREAIEALASRWGTVVALPYAEAFSLTRMVM